MSDYVIMSDTGCDIEFETLRDWGVGFRRLTFHFEDGIEHDEGEMAKSDFYARMRAGEVSRTSAVNSESFKELFEEALRAGKDILYLGFSSGISATSNSAQMAAKELREIYTDRKLITIDTLAASAGQGLILYLAVEKKKAGADIDENAKYVQDMLMNVAHWFTVEDLVYLKRGGRVSAAAAFASGVLGIKPVLHVDDEGHLINMMKVRGRTQSLKAIAKKYMETAQDPANGTYFISHGDCLEDAKELESMIMAEGGNKCALITQIGMIIGSHAGPGTVALFFLASGR
ncbi:MAG: DegV family protein [Lachnospiraceae bacterium]|nr:DegV family protein [Lachnospiraceae bacterium]